MSKKSDKMRKLVSVKVIEKDPEVDKKTKEATVIKVVKEKKEKKEKKVKVVKEKKEKKEKKVKVVKEKKTESKSESNEKES